MHIGGLKPAQQVALADGSLAEVLSVLTDTSEVRLRYIDVPADPGLAGQEAMVSSDDLVGVFEGTHTEGDVLGKSETAQWA